MKKHSFPFDTTSFEDRLPSYFDELILKKSLLISYDKNEFMNHEGDTFSYLFLLLEGTVKILRNEPNGKQRIAQFLTTGDFVGELALVQAETLSSDIVCISPVTALAIPQDFATDTLMELVPFLQMIARHIAEKMLVRTEHFTKNQLFELKYRLAMLLLQTAIDDSYTQKHTQIADYLGVSYRHLTHTFRWFRENGYIAKEGTYYRINRPKLERFIEERT